VYVGKGRIAPREVVYVAKPDTIQAWYRGLVPKSSMVLTSALSWTPRTCSGRRLAHASWPVQRTKPSTEGDKLLFPQPGKLNQSGPLECRHQLGAYSNTTGAPHEYFDHWAGC
jgi:hypothetical protein